ncbi:Hydrogenase maturation factor [Lachnospiraceae bacterium]|nr:Hydrogenase maturation factor [Lachnospiraceae bacterium]
MKGTIGSRILNRSIVRHIPSDETNQAAAGRDYAIIGEDTGSGDFIIAADGYSSRGVMAVIRAVNNLSMSGAAAEKLMISIVAGEGIAEQTIRDEMYQVNEYAKKKGFRVVGGNTVLSGEGEQISFTVTAFGRAEKSVTEGLLRKPESGDKLITLGFAGEYGASVIYDCKCDELRNRFSESYLKNYEYSREKADISSVAEILIKSGVSMLHDVSFGGIYRTLYEIGEYSGCGLDIIHEGIPIKQSTIELCEFYNINPYLLLGTGGVVAVVKKEKLEKVTDSLTKSGLDFMISGELTNDKKMAVRSENYNMNRSLNMYEGDEIYKVL